MITAVDSNVLLDLLSDNSQQQAVQSESALISASLTGPLIICVIVYAEVSYRLSSEDAMQRFLLRVRCAVTPVDQESAYLSGQCFRAYRQRGGDRTRILPDFLIAAHARLQAGRFLTRDTRFFGDHFDGLNAVHPADLTV